MIDIRKNWWIILIFLLANLTLSGCVIFSSANPDQLATPTPTEVTGIMVDVSGCEGLAGTLTMQILVGPSDIVEMEPVAVGDIPFMVVADGDSFNVKGGGPLNFDEQVHEADWGTYTVNFNADTTISGSCVPTDDGENLHLNIEMIGEQLVEVRAEGLQMDYPWSGTQEITVSFPAVEGAQEAAEGWSLILHINE